MKETQKTISEWATTTFGYPKLPQIIIDRLCVEVIELRNIDYSKDVDSFDKVSDECADILIVLYQIANIFGFNIHACVDHKMQINRDRKWKIVGDGTGQHIKEEI